MGNLDARLRNGIGSDEYIYNLQKLQDGTHTAYASVNLQVTRSFSYEMQMSNFIGSIDNISVIEVDELPADFTFSRGSNLAATRVNKSGLIEKGRENLLLYSNQFDSLIRGVYNQYGQLRQINLKVTTGYIILQTLGKLIQRLGTNPYMLILTQTITQFQVE